MTVRRRAGGADSELWLPDGVASLDAASFAEHVLTAVRARVEEHSGVSVAPHHVQVFADPAIDAALGERRAAVRERAADAIEGFARSAGHVLVAPVEIEWFSMGLQEPGTLTLTITFGRYNPSEAVADRTVEPLEDDRLTDPPGLAEAALRIAQGTPPELEYSATAPFDSSNLSELLSTEAPLPSLSELPRVQISRELAARSRPPWGVLVDAAGRKYLLRGSVVLGREAPSDLAVGEATVSGRHALLVCKGRGRCFVHDMDSLNGTAVNGTATRSIAPITSGDVLTFGSLSLRFDEV